MSDVFSTFSYLRHIDDLRQINTRCNVTRLSQRKRKNNNKRSKSGCVFFLHYRILLSEKLKHKQQLHRHLRGHTVCFKTIVTQADQKLLCLVRKLYIIAFVAPRCNVTAVELMYHIYRLPFYIVSILITANQLVLPE